MNKQNISIGEWIKFWRQECDMTQADLAYRVDRKQATVSRWEAGKDIPSVRALTTLFAIFKQAGVDPTNPPGLAEGATMRYARVIGDVVDGGRVHLRQRSGEAVPLPADMVSSHGVHAYEVSAGALPHVREGGVVLSQEVNLTRKDIPRYLGRLGVYHLEHFGVVLGTLEAHVKGATFVVTPWGGAPVTDNVVHAALVRRIEMPEPD